MDEKLKNFLTRFEISICDPDCPIDERSDASVYVRGRLVTKEDIENFETIFNPLEWQIMVTEEDKILLEGVLRRPEDYRENLE